MKQKILKTYLKLSLILGGLFYSLPVFAAACPSNTATTNTICNPLPNFFVDFSGSKYPNNFAGIFWFLVESGLGIVGMVSIGFLVWGGFQYITSRGNEEQATSSKKTIGNAIIGLIIVILSYVMVTVVINALKPGGPGV